MLNTTRNQLICPDCKCSLSLIEQVLCCGICKSRYETIPVVNFLPSKPVFENDSLDKLKTLVKKFPRTYMFLSEVVSPVFVSKKKLNGLIKQIEEENLVGLNIGSGVTNYSKNVVNFDLQAFKNVQVVGDLYSLPFCDDTFDVVFSIYVLEHVSEPQAAIEEMYRVLKPGGVAYCLIPFIQGFHAAPADFMRFTTSGIKHQFRYFSLVECRGLGPTSAFLWIGQEWLALILSFGRRRLAILIHLVLMCLTFPLKYLDIMMSRSSSAEIISSVNEVVAYKGADKRL